MDQPADYHEELLQKYLDGKCSPEEVTVLYTWLCSSDSHRPLLAAMRQDFERIMGQQHEVPESLSNRIETRLLQEISREKVVALPGTRRWKWAVAASVAAILATAATIFYTYHSSSPRTLAATKAADVAPGSNKAVLTLADGSAVTLDSAGNQVIQQGKTKVQQNNGQLQYAAAGQEAPVGYNILTVPRGGQFTVVLPDGTQVWLNSASSLRYPTAFTGNNRTVEMQGQGYFEVKPNVKQPFLVKVSNVEVQVLGTNFDIMAYPDENEVRTTLVQGAVKVKKGTAEKYLKPGQQVAIDNSTGNLSVRDADVQEVIAWKTGFFEFENANITTIMRQLGRWYDIEIDNAGTPGNQLFGGRINRNLPLSEMLNMLEANGAKFKLEGRKLTVIGTK